MPPLDLNSFGILRTSGGTKFLSCRRSSGLTPPPPTRHGQSIADRADTAGAAETSPRKRGGTGGTADGHETIPDGGRRVCVGAGGVPSVDRRRGCLRADGGRR